jgi:hypothetical protein
VLLALLQRDPWLVFDMANGQHVISPAAQLIQRKNSNGVLPQLSYG